VYIPKGKTGKRPLGIPTIEDKVLQESLRRILTPIYEEAFKSFSYVLDEWFSGQIQPLLTGRSFIVRYADDFVLGFENASDAERVMQVLPKRFEKYKLELHPDKTKLINLNSKRGESNRSFDFLGFTHYLGKSRKGYAILKRKTSSKKLTVALDKVQDWIKQNRHRKLKELIPELNAKLRGHYNYYGITFNSRGVNSYFESVKRILHK